MSLIKYFSFPLFILLLTVSMQINGQTSKPVSKKVEKSVDRKSKPSKGLEDLRNRRGNRKSKTEYQKEVIRSSGKRSRLK